MAYNYSNPFQPAPSASRSTFAAASGSTTGYQVIFSGLPLDVSEKDLKDLLINEPLGLAASTTSVRAFFGPDGRSVGTALIQVGNEADAERIRREYSGQTIDGTFKLLVQHVLPPTQPLPPPSVSRMAFPSASTNVAPAATSTPPTQPRQHAAERNGVKARGAQPGQQKSGAQPNAASGKPPGLALLSRLGKTGGAPTSKDKQMALLAKQKANLKASGGGPLLGRLAAKGKQAPVAAKAKAQAKVAAGGAAKVARAKKAMAMDVDKAGAAPAKKQQQQQEKPVKAKKPTQEDLDEEMRAYERQRRFGA